MTPIFHMITGAPDPVAPFSIGVNGLAKGALIEIDMVARRPATA